jgi:hypothetical protein
MRSKRKTVEKMKTILNESNKLKQNKSFEKNNNNDNTNDIAAVDKVSINEIDEKIKRLVLIPINRLKWDQIIMLEGLVVTLIRSHIFIIFE